MSKYKRIILDAHGHAAIKDFQILIISEWEPDIKA